jgi:hypothetical protein
MLALYGQAAFAMAVMTGAVVGLVIARGAQR